MPTPQLPDGLLTELLEWDENSFREHVDAMGRLFESLSAPDEVIVLARSWWSDTDHEVQALGFDLLAVQALGMASACGRSVLPNAGLRAVSTTCRPGL
ncbi:hypothetical protein GCM10010156_70300 [Planobispora rosea]|uniref:Uncharacterized protein n=1 Tax=Planobispora rosea TaxID=35762 RepID=A0A8J3SF35_PLARO|nr:hypothetical protein [Planobispora rosea]GGT02369.1 hypothetical protein GCM10010156_70300 [Planobispora rosea]GIH88558.1 hypothetical protein Pro02_69660 [Planobispora rosea]